MAKTDKHTSRLSSLENADIRREFLEKNLGVNLKNIANHCLEENKLSGKNIENFIGGTQIPLGIAGPIDINLDDQKSSFYIPLATSEGALVASVSRGCKAVSASAGANVLIENVGITRGPVFKTDGISHSHKVASFIQKNLKTLNHTAAKTSSHLTLMKADTTIIGKNIFVRFYFDTQDAMGMNMATFATDELVKIIEQKTKAQCVSIAGNFDVDKKPAWLNFILGRGKRVWAESIIKKEVVKNVLKTTPEKIAELVFQKCQLGSIASGSLGFNAHYANIIAAIFAATGQDLAHVVEGSLGVTTAEIQENGDLYFSIYLPSLIIGTVGGGTSLPTQKEALAIMDIETGQDVLKFAKIIAAAVLAGELSLISSQAEGSLAQAHKILAGNKK